MKDLKELKINVPPIAEMCWNCDAGVFEVQQDVLFKWKEQSEKINALLGKAFRVDGFSFSDGKGKPEPGFFIPLPEPPDSAEKLIEDLLFKLAFHADVQDFNERAKALLKKEGKV